MGRRDPKGGSRGSVPREDSPAGQTGPGRWGGLVEIAGILWSDADGFVKRRLAASVALVVLSSLASALGPLALKWLVDGFDGHGGVPPLSVPWLVLAYVFSQCLVRMAGELRGLVYARAERRLFRLLSGRFFGHVLALPWRFHVERQTGGVAQTLENGLAGYQMILHHLVFTVLPVTAELSTIVIVLLRLGHLVLLALFCGALLCYGAAFVRGARAIAGLAKTASAAQVRATARMTDALLNVELVKYFAAEPLVEQRVDRALSHTETQWVGFYRRYAVNGVTVSMIFAAFLAATTGYAVHEVDGGRLTAGDFVLISSYMLQVIRPVEALGYAMQAFSQGSAMLEKVVALFHHSPEPVQRVPLPRRRYLPGPGRVQFDRVSLSYAPDRPVLRDVSFEVPAGKTLAIVGASGSGKSSVVRLMARLVEPDSGRILLDGVPLVQWSLTHLRRSIAVVPQEAVLFNESVAENIAFGMTDCSQADIEAAAGLAQIHDLVASLPDGYRTPVGERGIKLSGGERQRLAIARAAIKRPRLYVFDEATSALDSVSERAISRNLQALSRSVTTVVITHRLCHALHADEILVLEAGRVVERGTHRCLVQRDGRYAAFWAAQRGGLPA